MVFLTAQAPMDLILKEELSQIEGVKMIKEIRPVLPVLSSKNTRVPFLTVDEMLAYYADKNLSLCELVVKHESQRGNISEDEVMRKMKENRKILKNKNVRGRQRPRHQKHPKQNRQQASSHIVLFSSSPQNRNRT